MGGPDIQTWIATARTGDEDGDSQSEAFWKSDRAAEEWPNAMRIARNRLLTSSTRVRLLFLKDELLPTVKNENLTLSQTLDIFKLLTQTYPRYVDTQSRDAVEAVGMELVRRDEIRGTPSGPPDESKMGVAEQVLGWLSNEAGHMHKRASSSSYSAADMFVLLSWSCGLYTTCLKANPDFTSSRPWDALVGTMAMLLDTLLHPATRAKPSMQKSGLVQTRRALRSVPDKLPVLMTTLIRLSKTSPAPLSLIPLLGVAVDVIIRLKNVKDPSLTTISNKVKSDIISIYANTVLMSKTPVPSHVPAAFNDFIRTFVTEDDYLKTVLPAMEKSLLRSPEHSLSVISEFFAAYSHPLSSETFRRLLASTINTSKSANPITRAASIGLVKVLVENKNTQESDLEFVAKELLTLPKAGKTTGPDHRVALYGMIACLPPSASVSWILVENVAALIAKETHDTAVSILAPSLVPHVVFRLRANEAIPKEATNVIVKEMNSVKPVIRRAFCSLVGAMFWELDGLPSDSAVAFAKTILPALEGNLKNVSTNPLGAPAGPLEGYVAVAVLLGPILRSGKFDDVISQNTVIKSLVATGSKPSFLFWDKVYTKLTNSDDQIWLLRAGEAALPYFQAELLKNEQLRIQVGSVFLYLGVESQPSSVRRLTAAALGSLHGRLPQAINVIVRESMMAYLLRDNLTSKVQNAEEYQKPAGNKEVRLAALLLATAGFADDFEQKTREELLADLIIVAHHPAICGKARQVWIELCQKSRVDPLTLVNNKLDKILELTLGASDLVNEGFVEASCRTVSTLAFVSPQVVLPRLVEQLRLDINRDEINSLTDTDIGIWKAPEGTTYVDVLSTKTADVVEKKGKGADIAKWEAEVRKSIANKKAAAEGQLSKQEQALVQQQLEREAQVRSCVTAIKAHLERGLRFVHSLIAARADEFKLYISPIVTILLEAALQKGPLFVGRKAYDTYIDLSACCSERLDTFRPWVGVATLRSLQVNGIPEEIEAEPLSALVLRVLYRLRSLSEQTPFDSSTFSYMFPLLSQVLLKGGVEVGPEDDPLEQILLILDIIKFHAGNFSDPSFPRKEIMDNLILTIRQQPRLAKEASTALIDIGQAVHGNATENEILVLLRGTLQQVVYVRNSCLQALQPFDLTDLDWSLELWISLHDEDEQNARLARDIWEDNGLDVPQSFLHPLLPFLEHDNSYVRSASALALAEGVEHWPESVTETLSTLEELYRERAKILAPEFDQYGMVVERSLNRTDPWQTRQAIAQAFEHLALNFTAHDVEPFFVFLIKDEALGDRSPDVRRGMLTAATSVIDLHGAGRVAGLISIFEDHLAKKTTGTEAADFIQEAIVILFGRVARHMESSDSRLPSIVNRLVEALKTPSEQVQMAVADCLGPLVAVIKQPMNDLVEQLMDQLFNGPKYAARRGAAYGLAGVVKGLGVDSIKDFQILDRIQAAAADKKRYESRQGAMFVLETFSSMLGRVFEPYVTHILPLLLTSFGDSTPDVREATQDAAKVIMANMSGYGVKVILPSLLSGLDEKQWRTKKGSIELLGMMAYCSPKQLSQSLPIVIPRLTGVLTDSHTQVRTAANQSLKQFGEVISNPEIQSLVPVLLKALVDPGKTPNALTSLLKTSFMHYIDHSSLALVIPIIERGLRERGADTKKKAAQIVGNLASLTDSKDFVPYLSQLLPMVHVVLVDPVPEARATAAKALGTLVERLGEIHFPDLVPGLLRTLKTDTSGVDRQGAAQGLSEVLSGLGMERLEGLLPDIIANAQSPRSTVREGFMTLLVFLPATFGNRFQPHLPKIISPILSGLADNEEYVRDASMRAGRMVVTNYSSKAIDLLLPELERGMFDPGWRIRQSSITLVGELLFKVSGISGKAEIEEDEEAVEETAVAETSRRALADVLGADRRDRILSALYLARQDTVAVVRQSSIHIWKALVHNTPRTVREILPELLGQIISLLSSSEFEQQETAARTISELCKKSGEKMMAEMVTILKAKSTSPDARTREGVCLAIGELLPNTGDTQRENHEDELVSIVRVSLVDDESIVRSAAAKAFDALQEFIGTKAIDQTIPTLLEALRQPGESSGTALNALREVMSVRASTVFPVLIPTLTATPMTVFNAHALASLVTVAGNALSKRLIVILTALVKERETNPSDELRDAIDEAIRALLASVSDLEGLNTLMLLLLGWCKHEVPRRRASACTILATFCEVSELDSSLYHIDWIRQLVSLLDDAEVAVHTAAWQAFDVFVKSVPKDELESLVVPLRRTIESTGAPGRHVPGFSLPKGVSPMVPIIIAGLTTGSNEQREQAAYAIGDLVERTAADAIKPFVVPFTGPLIRVATQATTYPPGVKSSILSALTTMLERIPAFVKPFFPQLQRTFVKSTSDPSSLAVRSKAAQALGVLMKNQPRVDPVVTELITGIHNNEDSIAASLILALSNVISSAGSTVGERARESCIVLVEEAFKEKHDESYVQSVAALIASLAIYPDLLKPIIETYLIAGTPQTPLSSHAILTILSSDDPDSHSMRSPNIFDDLDLLRSVASKVQEGLGVDRPSIVRPLRQARDLLKQSNHDSLQGLF